MANCPRLAFKLGPQQALQVLGFLSIKIHVFLTCWGSSLKPAQLLYLPVPARMCPKKEDKSVRGSREDKKEVAVQNHEV